MIELKETAVTLQQTPILKDISLVFPTGSKTCILGPNGCGKTTLLKTIAGLVPYSGSVLIDGQEVHGQKRKELATKVAMMSQFTTVAFDYTVYETVLMGAYRQQAQRFLPIVSKQEKERVLYYLERTGLLPLKDKVVNQLSGGQQQRAAIARALINEPKIIFADEPTGNLDSLNARELMEYLVKINKEKHTTIIMVTHDSFVASYSKKVYYMKDGHLDLSIDRNTKSQDDYYKEIVNVTTQMHL